MELKTLIGRAKRGLREELRLYLVAISSLSVAFLCVAGALLALTNLSALAERWGESARMTVYLRDGAQAADVAQLRVVLESLPEVRAVEELTAEDARALFLQHAEVSADLAALPPEVFPPSLELSLATGTDPSRLDAMAARVAQLRAVEDVETYRGWFDRLESLLSAGRGLAGALALLVALCVLAVIGNTIRLAVARRRDEIEVLKLCGATDAFVRGPFVVEGTFQGFAAAALAVMVLFFGFLALRGELDASLAALTGIRAAFLQPWMLVALIFGGAFIGAMGSALSLRRYLTV
ncbi:MAG: ABC transporter permease [Sandaracinus sp.]|nr:ABC transporter permease [Sandaracinus sp.]MCB9637135.1 ABC transporter permease [Sandaracinus sp.]